MAIIIYLVTVLMERTTRLGLKSVAEKSRGSFVNGPFGSDLLTSELQETGVPVVYIRDIRNGEYRRVSRVCVSEKKGASLRVCAVQPGDVLIAKVGDPPGISAVYPSGEPPAIVTQDVVRIRLDKTIASPEYVSFFLNSSVGRWKIAEITIEATRARFSLRDFKCLSIDLPSLEEQAIFATRIHVIEALKATHRAALTELDALFASLQHQAFRGELTRSAVSAAAPAKAKAYSFEALGQLDAEIGLEALIFVAKRIPDYDLYKTLKALYFGDKRHLEQHGRQIYGETHCALPMGPVPQAAYDATKVLSGELLISQFADDDLRSSLRYAKKQLIPLRDADFNKLGSAERESLEWAVRYCGPMSFDEVKRASHDTAYHRTAPNAAIALADIVGMLPAEALRHFTEPGAF